MAKQDPLKQLLKYAREADDIAKVVTGKRLMDLGSKVMSMMRNGEPPDIDDPYHTLGILRSATDRVVKFAFLACAYENHPDTGQHPDLVRFQKAKEAYDQIVRERRAGTGPG